MRVCVRVYNTAHERPSDLDPDKILVQLTNLLVLEA